MRFRHAAQPCGSRLTTRRRSTSGRGSGASSATRSWRWPTRSRQRLPSGLRPPESRQRAQFPPGAQLRAPRVRPPRALADHPLAPRQLPVPADWLSGPVDLYHSPDFVLPPLRHARGILTVHDLAFLLRPECADERLRAYLEGSCRARCSRADFIVADSENTRNDLVVLLGVRPSDRRRPGRRGGAFAPVTDPELLRRPTQRSASATRRSSWPSASSSRART